MSGLPNDRAVASHPFLIPGFPRDPYPVYRSLQASAPVLRVERPGGPEFVVTGYEDVRCLLRDERISADRTRSSHLRTILEAVPEEQRRDSGHSMLVRDEPAHGRLRRLVHQAFTRRSVATLEPRIRALAHGLLEACARRGRFDAVADYAEPLASLVIAELLGLEGRDHARFRSWTRTLLSGLLGSSIPAERVASARRRLDGYWLERIRERRAAPRGDLLSDLVEARDRDGKLSDLELLAMLNLILVAGHETSASLIASTLWTLLGDPRRTRAACTGTGANWEDLVEEMLRWQSPIQGVARAVRAELELAGVRIPAGAAVTAVLGAANRDPRVFPRPDRFEPGRENARLHLAFGFGEHFCLGAALARAEVRIAVRAALERFPQLRLEEPSPRWRATALLRGLERLPLRT